MESPKLTKTLPEVTKDTLPHKYKKPYKEGFLYDLGKPIKKDKVMLILVLSYFIFKTDIQNPIGTYEIRFEYTTDPNYNPLQICQVFHKAIEIGIQDFRTEFIKKGFEGYSLKKVVTPTFDQIFPALKDLYYPTDLSQN